MPASDSSLPVRRVSSQHTTSAAPSASAARGGRSPRLPIGRADQHERGRRSPLHLELVAGPQRPAIERAGLGLDHRPCAPAPGGTGGGGAWSRPAAPACRRRRRPRRSGSACRACAPTGTGGAAAPRRRRRAQQARATGRGGSRRPRGSPAPRRLGATRPRLHMMPSRAPTRRGACPRGTIEARRDGGPVELSARDEPSALRRRWWCAGGDDDGGVVERAGRIVVRPLPKEVAVR